MQTNQSRIDMKIKTLLVGFTSVFALSMSAQQSMYWEVNKPIEERVKDALNRMTLEEKVKMIHAQSKFSSAGVPRLGIPKCLIFTGKVSVKRRVIAKKTFCWVPV